MLEGIFEINSFEIDEERKNKRKELETATK